MEQHWLELLSLWVLVEVELELELMEVEVELMHQLAWMMKQ